MQHTVYLFDHFQLDVTRRKLLSSGGLVLPLNSRALEALLLLVANAGQVLERRRMMQSVWPNTIVEDNNLNQCVLAIRRALGESAGENRFVMTVPGRGFCFVCPVRTQIRESADEAARAAPPGASRLASPAWRGWQIAGAGAFWTGLVLGAVLVSIALLPLALH